jgi:membrane-bound lytic murein transglycosylase A
MRWSVLAGALSLAAAGLLSACAGTSGSAVDNKVRMAPISFNEIPGWTDDRQGEALAAFRRSCPKLVAGRKPGSSPMAARSSSRRRMEDDLRLRQRHQRQRHAAPPGASSRTISGRWWSGAGSFTGYFEPEMRGSRAPSRLFTVPVYRRPAELGDGPYYTRAEIEQGALKGKGLEIAWVQDPVALFEVQVQGSGRIHLAEGGALTIGFDGSNNRPYTAIGGVLADKGVMRRDEANWPAIRDWLKRNPQDGREVMRKNERYIFFKDTRSARCGRLRRRAAHRPAQPRGRHQVHAVRHADLDRHPAAGRRQAGRSRSTAAC